MKTRLSVIIAVLESYEVVRRQMLWYNRFLPKYPEVEFILVDDGSGEKANGRPESYPIPLPDPRVDFRFAMMRSHDTRPWTQPCARNLGALRAFGDYLLFTDVDHFFTEECIAEALRFTGDKLHFPRTWGSLDECGDLDISDETLSKYSPRMERTRQAGTHFNTFAIRRSIFEELKGYDPKFCGKYGGDDTDFSDRYSILHQAGKAERSQMAHSTMYVYPDPKYDRQRVFHHLRWGK